MWDYLSLPEKFRVNKHIELSDFLSKASFTDVEKQHISRFVNGIDLMYDIKYEDGSELILIDVSIDYRKNKWTGKEIPRYIANAIPHNCCIVTHDDDYGNFSAFVRRDNTLYANRSTIKEQAVTREIHLNPMDIYFSSLLGIMGNIIKQTELNAGCVSELLIKEIRESQRGPQIDQSVVAEEQMIINSQTYNLRNGLLDDSFEMDYEDYLNCLTDNDNQCSIEEAENETYDDEENYSSDTEINNNRSETIIDSIKALLRYAYYCYIECLDEICRLPNNIDDEEEDWLLDYGMLCQEVMEELYGVDLSEKFFYYLGNEFSKRDSDDIEEYMSDDAVQLLIADYLDFE